MELFVMPILDVLYNLACAKNNIMSPSMSVCRVSRHTVATMTLDIILQQWPWITLATMTLGHTVETIVLENIVVLDTIVALDNPLVSMLTSSSVMWRKEHLWNFTVFQRVHISSLVSVVCSYSFLGFK
jgi:hypothetical protein